MDDRAPARPSTAAGITGQASDLYRLLIESVQDYAIFALDPNGVILSWNAGAERFKGYRAEEVIGKHFSIFYPPDKTAEQFPQFELREAAKHGRFEDEGWRVRKDGSRFWANVVITALRDQSGQLIGYAKVTRDLSERRAAEDALRMSEERFRLLVQSIKDYAIFMLDAEGRVATWNEGAQRIKGYSADEIIGKHFSIFYPAELVESRFPDHELEVAAATGRFEDEGWRIRKDGSRFWANVVITALRDGGGHLLGFAKITRDLSERRAAEQRAIDAASQAAAQEAARHAADEGRERAERLQRLTSALSAAHSIPAVLDVVTRDGFVQLGVDAGALALATANEDGAEVADHVGYGPLAPDNVRVRGDSETLIAEAMRTKKTLVFRSRHERDARFPRTAQLLHAFETTVVVPLLRRDKSIGALSMHRRNADIDADDITLMEAFALQCSQAIERAKLYQAESEARREAETARRQADEANRTKSQFLASMSHELRTPLNAIGGYVQLLLVGVRGPVTDEQRADLERVERSQKHLLGVINDLLNFSRLEAGKLEYTCECVHVVDLLRSVTSMVLPQAESKQLRFRVIEPSAAATVWVDRAKTEQILLNLLSNAVKFTGTNGEIVLEVDEKDAGMIAISVADTGRGIPANKLAQIFEPFVQVGRSLSDTREGTGLGLAISRDLAHAMHGDITVESAPDRGSTFTLTLPREKRK